MRRDRSFQSCGFLISVLCITGKLLQCLTGTPALYSVPREKEDIWRAIPFISPCLNLANYAVGFNRLPANPNSAYDPDLCLSGLNNVFALFFLSVPLPRAQIQPSPNSAI